MGDFGDPNTSNGVTAELHERRLYVAAIDSVLGREDYVGEILFHVRDYLGSVRGLVQGSERALRARYAVDSFGNLLEETNPELANRFRYTGRELGPLLGQYYYRARSYDPSTGWYISVDPLGFTAGDSNFYRYALNRLVELNDPDGQLPEWSWWWDKAKKLAKWGIPVGLPIILYGLLTETKEEAEQRKLFTDAFWQGRVLSCPQDHRDATSPWNDKGVLAGAIKLDQEQYTKTLSW
jgi:RHS repeat-associated protein